jgi:hypothetical protein
MKTEVTASSQGFHIALEPDLADRLRDRASREGLSPTEALQRAVREYLEQELPGDGDGQPTARIIREDKECADRLDWAVGEVIQIDRDRGMVQVDLGRLRFAGPVYLRLRDVPRWMAQRGQCFEARINLQGSAPDRLCFLNPTPVGRPEETVEEVLDRLEARLQPVADIHL